jgi:alpha-N-arabinofuranosidase
MRRVDPRIKLGIVMVPGPGNDVNSNWNQTVIRLAGASADFVTIHMYAPQHLGASIPEDVRMESMMVAPQHVEERLRSYHQMIRQQLGHDLPLAITEFNGGLDDFGSPDRFTFADALECADLLRVFLKPESNVAMANYWQFVNGYFGMLRTTMISPDGEPSSEEPVFPLYELWARHFGSKLVKVEVQSPRAEFSGAGSEEPAKGNAAEPIREIQRIDLKEYSSLAGSLWPRLLNVRIERQDSAWTIHLQDLNHSIYPTLAQVPRPDVGPSAQVEFSVSFDAQFTPDPGSTTAPMGIGLMDSRGWNQTHSGIGVDGITAEWKHYDATYRLDPQTPNVDITARLMAEGKRVSGTLQIHNLTVSDSVAAHGPAYPLLTSLASTSSDGNRVYLIVFNKSATGFISTAIHLAGFKAASARYWEVNGPSLQSTTGVHEIERDSSLPMSSESGATHVFPAHSMTAVEFSGSH